jgi:hypothetical protein
MWTFDETILSISKIEFFFFCDLNKIYMYIVCGITNVVQLCYSRHSLDTNIPFLFSMFEQKDMDLRFTIIYLLLFIVLPSMDMDVPILKNKLNLDTNTIG